MWLFFRISLFLMNFSGQIICRIFPHCNVYYSFLIRQRLWAFRRKDTDVKCHFITIYQQCLLSTFLITIYIDFDHLAEVVFVVFFTVKLLFFFFFSFLSILRFLGGSNWVRLTLMQSRFMFSLLEDRRSPILIYHHIHLSGLLPLICKLPDSISEKGGCPPFI